MLQHMYGHLLNLLNLCLYRNLLPAYSSCSMLRLPDLTLIKFWDAVKVCSHIFKVIGASKAYLYPTKHVSKSHTLSYSSHWVKGEVLKIREQKNPNVTVTLHNILPHQIIFKISLLITQHLFLGTLMQSTALCLEKEGRRAEQCQIQGSTPFHKQKSFADK